MKRIHKVGVLGSGVMGSALACHLANVGFEVLMLDILPKGDDIQDRNAVARKSLKQSIKSKPAPLYSKSYASRISLGNFEDDLEKLADCDWILEAIIERLDIKNALYDRVEKVISPDTLVSSNTSGIPIHMMASGRSESFRKNFCGTHFFNPPRYLKLFELIPGPDTTQETLKTMEHIGSQILGKQVVYCKDTPAFIANRIGVFAMSKIYEIAEELEMDIRTVDKLTGPAIGRPKTGTFRLGDLVGLDVAAKVIKGVQNNCPQDQLVNDIKETKAMKFLLENELYGNKSGQGFYKKTNQRDENGRRIIEALNLNTLEYSVEKPDKIPSEKTAKLVDDPEKRIQALCKEEDTGGELLRRSMAYLFSYAAQRIPEIADEVYSVDDALRAGFGWEYGPFQYWDIIGFNKGLEMIENEGLEIPQWIQEMKENGQDSFYTSEGTDQKVYSPQSSDLISIPRDEKHITLRSYGKSSVVFENDEVNLKDIGDGVLALEFTSKMNAIGEGVLRGTQKAIQIAEDEGWKGLVIANDDKNFTVGANLMMLGMLIFQQEWDQVNDAVKLFQDTSMRCRFSEIPVVAATQGYVFGGGCEYMMHCDAVVASAESYIGLVEAGVGLLPGGGGSKEFALRASDEYDTDTLEIPALIERFKTLAMAQVATSAAEAFEHGYLMKTKDEMIVNADFRIGRAKEIALELSDDYIMPIKRKDIKVLGRGGLAALYTAANSLKLGHYASEHDVLIAKKIAYVLCGGDLTGSQEVSEDYLLDIEREAFLSLCGEAKTLERIQYMLENNKPLRN